MAKETSAQPDYSVPALEKALDIIELLAERQEGLTQNQIGEAVGRSASQIFRTLAVLEDRGYLWKARPSGLYFLSMRMFELAHRHPPTRGLVQVAMPMMRELAQNVRQSCNLGVYDFGRMIIVAEAESPTPFGFRVRVGGHFALLGAASGRALLAFQDEAVQAEWLSVSDAGAMKVDERTALISRLADVRARGHEQTRDGLHAGVSDLAFPVLVNGQAIAALTVPYVSTSYSETPMDQVIVAVGAAASAISEALGGN